MTSPITRSSTPLITPRATILFADDDIDTREMMKVLLRFDGYEVITAADGREAIDTARRRFPDLILIDLELPKLDGISVAKTLKRDPQLKAVPIVMISGHSPAKFREVALEAGCDDYLFKPLDFSRIQELLNRIGPVVTAQPERRRHAVA